MTATTLEFAIQYPHDHGSDDDVDAAMEACFGDEEDDFDDRAVLDALSGPATAAGLTFVRESDFGAIWTGTEAQFAACVEALPTWAKRYAVKVA